MQPLPAPPVYLADWLTLLGLITVTCAGLVGAARRWLVNPLLKEIRDHAEEHADARETRKMLNRELAPNGHEDELPYNERNMPMRQIAIRNRTGVLHLEREVGNHRAYSERVLQELNADRIERGLNPIEPEHRTGEQED